MRLIVIGLSLTTLVAPNALVLGAPPVRDSERRFARTVKSWHSLKRQNIVMQETDYSCGAAALATLVKYYLGDNVDEDYFLEGLDEILKPEEIEERIENGLTMTDIRKVAVYRGYQAAVARMKLDKLFEAKVPLLIGIDVDGYKHFVIYRGFDGFYVYLADPIRGNIRVSATVFQGQWQKNLALAIAKKGLKPNYASPLALNCRDFVGQTNKQFIQTQHARGSIHQTAGRPKQVPLP